MKIAEKQQRQLIEAACKAAENSYSPYSKYRVGAAVLTADGRVYTGCNVENSTIAETVCAERTAFVKAVSEGVREFRAVAVAVAGETAVWPCGFCRQFMAEFGREIPVFSQMPGGKIAEKSIAELLPDP